MKTDERGREEDVAGWILSRPYILVYWSVSIWVCSLFLHAGVGLFLSLFLFFMRFTGLVLGFVGVVLVIGPWVESGFDWWCI